jgi:flagellar biosynthesis protein FliP
MKDGLICGMLVGIALGALLFKHSPTTKDIINKAETAVKNEVTSMVKELDKKVNK